MSSSRMQGMDTEQAREISQNMGEQAGQVAGVVAGISQMIAGLNWHGPDRKAFESDWSGSFAPQANTAAEQLSDHARNLAVQADRQDEASR